MSTTFIDRSIFVGAFYRETLIAFAKLVSDHNYGQASLMQILSMASHNDKSPNNALIAEAVRCCADRGIPYLVYSKLSYGRKERDGLADFKQHNGFRRIEMPRYYVPLTLVGQVALRVGVHRGFVRFVPEPMLAVLRAARRFCYTSGLRNSG